MRNVSTAHLPAASEEERFDAAHEVEMLMQLPGWDRLMEGVAAKREALANQLTAGVKQTTADYERIIGEMRGLDSVEAIANGYLSRGGIQPNE